jgi:hypothetical protein
VGIEVLLYRSYLEGDGSFHWFTHFFAGASVALGIMTLAALRRGRPVPAAVRRLQELLATAGFPVDTSAGGVGTFGPRTHKAVSAFQAARGLGVDGIVGPRTWAALKSGIGPRGGGLSEAGAALIEGWEGFRSSLYNDPAGHCTIGFGHLVHM